MLKLSGKSRDTCQRSPATLHAHFRVLEPRVEPWVRAFGARSGASVTSRGYVTSLQSAIDAAQSAGAISL